jgi:SAM-dependent methyltransferase
MRNIETWKETKYSFKNGQIAASSDPKELSIGSRVIGNLVARSYQDALPRHATGHLLDLGCGKVPLFAAYRDFVTEVTCVDWGNSLHNSDHLDKECDLTASLTFDAGTFDTIILSDVLEHVPTPELLCREMARVLVPGGKLIMNVPFFYWLHECPHDYYRYTEFALRRLMEVSGLKIVSLSPVGGAVEIIFDIAAKNALRFPGVGRGVAATIQYLSLWFLCTKIGRRVSKKTASEFPLFYFVVAEKH